MTTLYKLLTYSLLTIQTISIGHSKEIYFFGGGGEPSGPTTIFDGHINLVSKFITAKGADWKSVHSFNGGHSETEAQIEKKLSTSTALGPFNEKNFLGALSDLEKKIESGELKSGEQLMLVIDSHGAMKSKSEKTHSIALNGTAENLKTLSGARTVSMDKLEKIIALATEKGVKLALIDLSCFSGNTLKIANPNVCVVSASGSNHYGYSEVRKASDTSPYWTFGGRFLEGFKKGANLEDIFLKARAGSISSDFPMISTETGLAVNELIYQLITPYLVYNYSSTTDFSDSYDAKKFDEEICKTSNQFAEIQKRINELTALANIPKKLLDTKKLQTALSAYRDYQVFYEKALGETKKAGKEVHEIIQRDYPEQAKLFEKEDGLSILTVSRDSALKTYKEMIDTSKSEWSKKFYQKIYDELLLKDNISKEISSKLSEESKSNIKKFDDIFKRSGKTKELADNVARESKVLYDKLYRHDKKARDKIGGNPCKDFVL